MEENVTPVKNRIMLSEQTLVRRPEQLQDLMSSAIKQGLEGLVMKDLKVCMYVFSLCVCVCVCVCVSVCVCVYVCVHSYVYMHLHVCMHVCMQFCLYSTYYAYIHK